MNLSTLYGLPGGSVVRNMPANAGDAEDMGSSPGSGRYPEGRRGNPLQYSCLENSRTCPLPGGLQSTGSQRAGHDWARSHTPTCPSSMDSIGLSMRGVAQRKLRAGRHRASETLVSPGSSHPKGPGWTMNIQLLSQTHQSEELLHFHHRKKETGQDPGGLH